MNLAFAGLRHGHIFALYTMAKEHPEFTVAGAWEEDAASREAAEKQGLCCCYKTYEELLADPSVDAVAFGGCFTDRGPLAIEALRAGKHVIADKPLCTTLAELDEIERLAKEKGLFVSCMFTLRYEKKMAAVKALCESGELGEINNVYFGGQHPLQYGRRPMWYFEPGKHGGTINDIAIHGIDMLKYAFGLKLAEVNSARCWNKYAVKQPHFKDCGQFMATADNGAGILSDVSYAIPDGIEFGLPYYWRFYAWGTEGVIEFSEGAVEPVWYKKGDPAPRPLPETEAPVDYLTDVLCMMRGEKCVLTMQEVFDSTRAALTVQAAADR